MRIPVIKPNVTDMEELRQQLIQIQDNVNRALGQLSYDYTQTITFKCYPGDFPMLIRTQMPRPAWGLKIVYLRNLTDDSASPLTGPFPDWYPESGGIKIRNISDLASGNLYEIRMIAYA